MITLALVGPAQVAAQVVPDDRLDGGPLTLPTVTTTIGHGPSDITVPADAVWDVGTASTRSRLSLLVRLAMSSIFVHPGVGHVADIPAKAEPPLDCTTFQDWNEVDGFWHFFWAGDDEHHMHASGTIPDDGGDWVLVRHVTAFGWQHKHLVDGYTDASGEHGTCSLEG